MSFLKKNLGKIGGALVGGPIGLAVGQFGIDQPNQQRSEQQRLEQQQADQRMRALNEQLGAINQLQAPQVAPATQARLQALLADSAPKPLEQDTYFQGDRANLVSEGRRQVAGVQNRQGAYDVRGGFGNVGSMQNVYDRLGSQLASLGQRATEARDQRSQAAADLQQRIVDSQRDFENYRTQARAALIAGDANAAQAALQNAYNAKRAIDNAQTAFFGTLAGAASQVGASALTGGVSQGLTGVEMPQTQMPQVSNQYSLGGESMQDYFSNKDAEAQRYQATIKRPAYSYLGR